MATRCSTNPPLCLTARYTSISFQRYSQLSFAVAMIIRSIHFRCCAMRIRAIPSPFQRKTALRVSVAIYALPYFALPLLRVTVPSNAFASRHQPRIALAFLCAAPCQYIALRFISMPLPNNASPLSPSPLRFCARRLFTLPFLCSTILRRSSPFLSFSILCYSVAARALARQCHCFSRRIEATHFDAQPSRVTASQYFAFTMRNVSQLLHFSATPVSAFPLRCRDTHRPAKPLLFFWFQNRTQPILCSSWPCGAPPLRCCAFQLSAVPLQCHAGRSKAHPSLRRSGPGRAVLSHCPVWRAYQPAFSSGKKFASCIM